MYRLRSAVPILIAALASIPLRAQWWDAGAEAAAKLAEQTDGKLIVNFEFRTRAEGKTGVTFGKDPDLSYGLIRTRFGLTYKPVAWLKFSGMVQDSRAPGYGPNAPSTVRDPADLQEAYVELFPDQKTGFGFSAGRRMITYGEGRLIGIPDWTNLSRTYDHARASYRWHRAKIEMLFASPVKIQVGDFNKPLLGDRVWGTYDVLPNVWGENSIDAYVLRRDQNRPGGFVGGSKALGTDNLGLETYGFRAYGPVGHGVKYSIEGALQSGRVGPASQRGSAWFSNLNRTFQVANRPWMFSGEYKYASGNKNPADPTHVGTFDQLYPANHDKFGHEDLFGWRNVHNLRSLESYGITKTFALNFMYDNIWLASAKDALYNGQGKVLVQSAGGTAGRHVGQETDLFGTYKYRHWVFGAGGGYLFKGDFIQHATPGVSPTYVYLFQSYAF